MIEHIPALMESGIASFKIEGRMKSAYYAAVTSNTYRMAMDAYARDGANYTYDPAYLTELESVNHREYCTGYFFDDPMDTPQLVTKGGYLAENVYLATALSYDEATGLGKFVQRNKFVKGDTVELLTPGKTGKAFVAEALFDENGTPIESTPHPYMPFFMQTPFPIKEGDILRLK
jgi:putative protease